MFAKVIEEKIHVSQSPCAGHSKLYEIRDKKGKVIKYLYADYAYTKLNGIITIDNIDETMVFECDKDGTVKSWEELWCGEGDHVIDNSAILDMGYFLYSA